MLLIDNLSMTFGDTTVLDRFSLAVERGDTVALLGASGSGKSTILRLVAGLLVPDAGQILLDGVDITSWPTHRRNIGLVFQDEQLFPHLDVAGNIGYSLKVRGDSKATRAAKVDELLTLVGLAGYQTRAIDKLSGGEKKRVAVARSLAGSPSVLLLDEPLTGLDRELHDRLAADLAALLAPTTAIWVTHDHAEAAVVADHIIKLPTPHR